MVQDGLLGVEFLGATCTPGKPGQTLFGGGGESYFEHIVRISLVHLDDHAATHFTLQDFRGQRE